VSAGLILSVHCYGSGLRNGFGPRTLPAAAGDDIRVVALFLDVIFVAVRPEGPKEVS
jgi:hypothetical protein